jgi:hypothetical protein
MVLSRNKKKKKRGEGVFWIGPLCQWIGVAAALLLLLSIVF